MEVVYYDVNQLKPYKNNPRFNKASIEQVAESIKQFGFKVPIIIDKNLEIIAGHTRLEASKLLKLQQVPCIVADDLNEEQIKAFRLADNKVGEIATWDYDKLEQELEDVSDEEAELLGFIRHEEIDWDDIDDLDEDTYEEPQHRMMQCPLCNHIDRDIHFKKVSNNESNELEI